MRVRNTLTLVLAIVVSAIVIIGLFNFGLMLEIWVKVFIGVLLVGVLVTIGRSLFLHK